MAVLQSADTLTVKDPVLVSSFYMNNAVGMWFTPLALDIYALLPGPLASIRAKRALLALLDGVG